LKTDSIWIDSIIRAGSETCESGDPKVCETLSSRIRWEVPDGFIVPCEENYYLDKNDGKCKQETCKEFQYLGTDGKCTKIRCNAGYNLLKDGKTCKFDSTKSSGDMYYPNLISFSLYLYYLYVQGPISGLGDLIISIVYLANPDSDFNLQNGPTRVNLGEGLFSFMEYSEKAVYIVLLVTSLLSFSLNGYWVVVS